MWDNFSFFLYFMTSIIPCFYLSKKRSSWRFRDIFIYVLFMLPCTLLMAERDIDVGIDLIRYSVHVDRAYIFDNNYLLFIQTEPFESIINYISYKMGSFHYYILITSIIHFTFLAFACYRFNRIGLNAAVVFILFVATISIRSYSMVRNGLALSSSLIAYSYLPNIEKKEQFKFWFFSIVALGFHNASIINVLIYIICRPYTNNSIPINRIVFKRVFLIIGGCLFLSYLGTTDIFKLIQTVDDGRYESFGTEDAALGIGNTVMRIPIILLAFHYMDALEKNFGRFAFCSIMLLLADLFVIQLRYLVTDFERLGMFTDIGSYLILGMLYPILSMKYGLIIKWIYIIYVTLTFVYFMYKWGVVGNYGLMPYHMWK